MSVRRPSKSLAPLALLLGSALLMGAQPAGKKEKRSAADGAGPYAEAVREIERLVATEMEQQGIVGLSIALVDGERIVWADGFGWADRDRRVPATAETVYRMGSVSKVFTGTAVMQLVDQGLIDIDAPIADVLPEFNLRERFAGDPPITARNLMTHHAGVPSDLLSGADTRHPEPLYSLTDRLAGTYEAQPTGAVFQYSNLGFAVLGRLVERVTGEAFADRMTACLLKPLGMDHSSFVLDDRVRPHLSRGYIGGEEREQYPVREQPAGSLYSSARDVGRFLAMVLGGGARDGRRIIGRDQLEAMLSPQNAGVARDLDVRVGLTWQLTNRLGPGLGSARIAWHEGWLWHFSSFAAVLPDHGLGVVVAANSDSARKSVTRIGLDALGRLVQAKWGRRVSTYVPQAQPVTLPTAELSRYAGEYDTSAGLVAFEIEEGALQGNFSGGRVRLVPLADGTFAMRRLLYGFLPYQSPDVDGYQLDFVEVDGRTLIATLDRGTRIPFGERIEQVPIPRRWRARLGRYENRDADEDFVRVSAIELSEERGFLTARVVISGEHTPEMTQTMALDASAGETAFVMGVGRFRGDAVRVVRVGGRPALEFQGYRLVRADDRHGR